MRTPNAGFREGTEARSHRGGARCLLAGARHGAIAWLTFGLLEHLCLSVLPAWRESSLLLVPASRAASLAAMLAGYTLGGAFLGGAAAAGWWSFRRRGGGPPEEAANACVSAAPDLATATIVLVWIPHLFGSLAFSRSAYLCLAVAGLLAAALGVRLSGRLPRASRLAAWLVSPAGASASLLVPLVVRDHLHLSVLAQRFGPSASAYKAAAAAAAALALAGLLGLGAAVVRANGRPGAWRGRLAIAAGLAFALVAASVSLDRAALGRIGQGASAAGRAPGGVLLITLDAVRADHLTPYGYSRDTTPNLAAFARRATLYLDARAASDMSLGTHASLFTGKYPSRHGAWVGEGFPIGRPLPASERTLAERLGAAGWARFASVANGYFLNGAYGLSRGFELFDVPAADRVELRWRLRALLRRLSPGGMPVHRSAREVSEVLAEGLAAARRAGRPFFAFANYMEAHDPYAPAPDLRGRFDGYDPALPVRVGPFIGAEGTRRVFDPRERRHLVSLYDSAIATLDRELGRLFDRMRALGVYDGTLIVIMADHGEMLGERGTFGHGAGLVDEVLHIPLIVKFPFQEDGRRVSSAVSQVDVVPTVLEAAGLAAAAGLDGISLRAAEQALGRVVLAESPPDRAVYRAGGIVRERIGAAPAAPDPDAADRLKSLGYVR